MKGWVATESTGLLEFLVRKGYTRTKAKQLLKRGAVTVNELTVEGLAPALSPGNRVSISRSARATAVIPPMGIRIIHEDDALLVIEKPAGLLAIATEKERTKTAYYQLNEYLKRRNPEARERVFIVHRLDRDTSGLMLFAKNEAVKRKLQDQWKKVEKRYYAVVEGVPGKKEGEITSHLRETSSLKVYSSKGSPEAKYAITKYWILKAGRRNTLLDVVLETGRKNQIRVHLADIGHPVVGDMKYGAQTDPIRRLALHAYVLSLRHPVKGKPLEFRSPLPDRLKSLIRD